MRGKRIGIDIFVDVILSLERPIGITGIACKTRMDHRLTVRNLKRLTELGLVKINGKPRKIALTNDGIIIFNILNKVVIKEGDLNV